MVDRASEASSRVLTVEAGSGIRNEGDVCPEATAVESGKEVKPTPERKGDLDDEAEAVSLCASRLAPANSLRASSLVPAPSSDILDDDDDDDGFATSLVSTVCDSLCNGCDAVEKNAVTELELVRVDAGSTEGA